MTVGAPLLSGAIKVDHQRPLQTNRSCICKNSESTLGRQSYASTSISREPTSTVASSSRASAGDKGLYCCQYVFRGGVRAGGCTASPRTLNCPWAKPMHSGSMLPFGIASLSPLLTQHTQSQEGSLTSFPSEKTPISRTQTKHAKKMRSLSCELCDLLRALRNIFVPSARKSSCPPLANLRGTSAYKIRQLAHSELFSLSVLYRLATKREPQALSGPTKTTLRKSITERSSDNHTKHDVFLEIHGSLLYRSTVSQTGLECSDPRQKR